MSERRACQLVGQHRSTQRYRRLPAEYELRLVARMNELARLFDQHGRPEVLRSDNGREFVADSLGAWLAEQGVKTAFIEKGSPQQNAFVERFNGTMRDEFLNGEEFDNLLESRVMISNWLVEYNTLRPHRGLGMLTPAAYAASCNEGPK